jgi:alpha-tubulin suppressor-like RCC1 family protein
MSRRYLAAIIKPSFNPLAAQTSTYSNYLYAWGNGGQGQLGLGNTTSYSSPKQVGSLFTWASSIAKTGTASFAVKIDGTLWSWGSNSNGQLGLGNTTSYSSPKQIGALTNWLSISAGFYFAVAIKTDGTIWSWGQNDLGQLGLGNTTYYSSPKQIGSLTNWSTLTCSTNGVVLSIKTDGTLWAWGNNASFGMLGQGNTISRSSPVQVGALTTWAKVSAPGTSVSAVTTGGTLFTWGNNNQGQLGLGNVTLYSSPKQVGVLTNWATPRQGNTSAMVIKTDGTLWTWGESDGGRLGLGNLTKYSSPKQVGSLTTWRDGSMFVSTFAIKTDGTLWSWGSGFLGLLGLGNTTYYSSPKQVGSLTNWVSVATNNYATIAVAY